MADLQRFHFHAAEQRADTGEVRPTMRGVRGPAEDADVDLGFNSDEAAARFHLSRLLAADDRPALRGITAPERAERVPYLHHVATQEVAQTGTRLVTFEQTKDDIPIFGGKAVCEL